MEIRLARTDAEIRACFPVIEALRPHLEEGGFVARIRAQERAGYLLAYVEAEGRPAAAAGFRICENLAWGKFLYVDDLVTLPGLRSRGHGRELLAWIFDRARREGCAQVHLDSGVQRLDAHRFYEREGMPVTAYHFSAPAERR